LPSIQKLVQQQTSHTKLVIIPKCGHVVNVENAVVFNNAALSFINNLT
jgi:pimeloyl-ACP methyl ester carboxylesterase